MCVLCPVYVTGETEKTNMNTKQRTELEALSQFIDKLHEQREIAEIAGDDKLADFYTDAIQGAINMIATYGGTWS